MFSPLFSRQQPYPEDQRGLLTRETLVHMIVCLLHAASCLQLSASQNRQDYTVTWSVDDVEEKRLSFGVRQNNSHWCALDPYSPLQDRKPGLSVKRKKIHHPV